MFARNRRTGSRLAGAAILIGMIGLLGCTSVREVGYAEAVCEDGKALRSEKGLGVAGYVDRKAERHEWRARASLNPDGSITFRRKKEKPETLRVPRRDVQALLVHRTDWNKVGSGFGFAAAGVGYVVGGFFLGVFQVILAFA